MSSRDDHFIIVSDKYITKLDKILNTCVCSRCATVNRQTDGRIQAKDYLNTETDMIDRSIH